eukprot:CAMPEP_0177792864 /NCGR_PEP_ID=MMETSP0491_2-20121128/24753_1 /TAXON_ID=63592 /ORGANISM="Tetraselmis chuii, Strain PLY429" /LENGTH=80 /DNA_ID=CAMNT_0019315309 /DNA_START=314 /DNA_END=552 /DNA_ORIENTATION=+
MDGCAWALLQVAPKKFSLCFPADAGAADARQFDLTLLGSCLLALLVAKMPVPGAYSFGFVRAEVLSAFANSCYLLFLAFT